MGKIGSPEHHLVMTVVSIHASNEVKGFRIKVDREVGFVDVWY